MTRYHVDVEFVADGRTFRDSYNIAASASPDNARYEANLILSAAPHCHYDRTARLYADETVFVAEWSEKAVRS